MGIIIINSIETSVLVIIIIIYNLVTTIHKSESIDDFKMTLKVIYGERYECELGFVTVHQNIVE